MAGTVKGYQQAAKRYRIHAVCAVGLSQTGTQIEQVREKTHIPDSISLFTLQGAFHLERLRGAYKLMMQLMVKTAGKSLAAKPDRTPEENDLLAMMTQGGDRVCLENLQAVLDWYHAQ